MKNYVCWTSCTVKETKAQFGIAPCGDPANQEAYVRMHAISLASARKFLAGEWEPVVFTDPAETRVHMFRDNWKRVWDIWHGEPCNLLYLDSDAMFIKPTVMFGRFQEFRLFNWSDPKRNQRYNDYFNAGVRYYPSSMHSSIWKIGQDMADNWNLDIWDQEQLIFNEMFWKQTIPDHDRRHPELNWQGMGFTRGFGQGPHDQWNQFPLTQAQIIHVHGSRGPVATAKIMEDIARKVGIELA